MASEEIQQAAAMMREAGTFGGDSVDVQQMREQMEAMAGALPLPDDVHRGEGKAKDVPTAHIAAPDSRQDRGVLYLHGGGYVLGSINTHAEMMGRISRACRAPVLGVDYRLAPEHPYPAAVDDAVTTYEHLLGHGIKAEQIVIAGDSAGGGLTLACVLALKERGLALPAGLMLLSPWTDLSGSGESIRSRAELDPMISPVLLDQMASLYRGEVAAQTPGVSPLFGDLSGMPPMLVQVGDHEILLDDSTRLVDKAQAVGVDVKLEIYDGGFHVFQNNPTLPESADAMVSMGNFFDRVTA